jgi:excisionase family DNA binding protein
MVNGTPGDGAIYTTREVASMLKVSRRAVQWLIKSRRLKAVRLGNGYRVRQQSIDEFFTRQEACPGEPKSGAESDAR